MRHSLPYRPNVAALIRVGAETLACLRAEKPGWQCVQGGLEGDETPEEGIIREVCEELGVQPQDFAISYRSRYWRRYLFPPELTFREGKQHCGQEQLWFEVLLKRPEAVDLTQSTGEFTAVKLMPVATLLESYVHWKRLSFYDFCCELGLA